jgi:predicted O-methyltransferase YrrM
LLKREIFERKKQEKEMSVGMRSNMLQLMVRVGLLPADTLLLYDNNAFDWYTGFGPYAQVMYSLVISMKPHCVVEIGSAYGYSTCFIAAALQRTKSGKLLSIDPHEKTGWNDGKQADNTYDIVKKRLSILRLSAFVEIIRAYSYQAVENWIRPIDILLVDGSHTYADVKRDFEKYIPHVKPGGYIVFHDTMWEYHKENQYYREDQGVPKFVQELQDIGYPMVTLREGWGLTLVQNSLNGFKLLS